MMSFPELEGNLIYMAETKANADHETPKVPGGQTALQSKLVQALECYGIESHKIVHAKVTRHMGGAYQVHSWHMEYLAALVTYCKMNETSGISSDRFICWTGARGNWKKRMERASWEALKMGTIEKVKKGTGYQVKVTEKGTKMIDAYRVKFIEVLGRIMNHEPLREVDRRRNKANKFATSLH